MGRTAKIVLGVLAGFALLCVISGVLGMRYAKRKAQELARVTEETARTSRAWAQGHAQADCVDEGLRRAFACEGVFCQVEQQVFVQQCLVTAAPTPGLCEGTPPPRDFMATAQWRSSRCMVYTAGDQAQRCQNLLSALLQHCQLHPTPAAPAPAPPTPEADASAAPAPSVAPAAPSP
ncbi:MAG: hypothetical protein HY909_04845 [Deltaproteobacteria bacterium]|nr:hypothetical protein [Deltaproteobacteria bacterium]